MQLTDIFTYLSLGPLSNLAVGGSGSGVIPDAAQPRITAAISRALLALYGRWNLLEKEVVIRVTDTINTYELKREHADTAVTSNASKYLQDTVALPFIGDVIRVLAVYSSDYEEQSLNDPGDPTSLYTPFVTTLLVPVPVTGDYLHVLYQAGHPALSFAKPVDGSQLILLPEVLIPALESHVAYQVFSAMNGDENTTKAVEYLSRYESLSLEIEVKDLVTTSLIQTHNKLYDRGFV